MTALFDRDAVLAAIDPATAVERTRDAFLRHHAGEWEMPAKLYVDAPPAGDFRAMPARGGGLAILKWVTSFPASPTRGLPVVAGAVLISSDATGELLAIADCAAVTSLRTGAAAAVSAQALALPGVTSAGIVGCGVNGSWAARCLAAVGFDSGVCADVDPRAAASLADELGWSAGDTHEALGCDVIVTVTPGEAPLAGAADLRPGSHLALLGADGHGKAELTPDAVAACTLFCDEWVQASGGGELAGPFERGEIAPADVTEIGEVLAGAHPGRSGPDEITAFDSTGLAIQDLAIAHALIDAWRGGDLRASDLSL